MLLLGQSVSGLMETLKLGEVAPISEKSRMDNLQFKKYPDVHLVNLKTKILMNWHFLSQISMKYLIFLERSKKISLKYWKCLLNQRISHFFPLENM